MAGASSGFHEDESTLTEALKDRHRALVSIMEELEAVDWYDQRVEAASDADLAEILGHNRDEEKEHAAMTIEWLRRHDETWNRHLRTYLFTDDDVLEVEEEAEHGSDARRRRPRNRKPDRRKQPVNHLKRELAPISDAAWAEIDSEAKRSITNFLAARRLVDFDGPLGWSTTCVATGRTDSDPRRRRRGLAASRRSRPLVELRAPFTLARDGARRRGSGRGRHRPRPGHRRRTAHRPGRGHPGLRRQRRPGITGLVGGSPPCPDPDR